MRIPLCLATPEKRARTGPERANSIDNAPNEYIVDGDVGFAHGAEFDPIALSPTQPRTPRRDDRKCSPIRRWIPHPLLRPGETALNVQLLLSVAAHSSDHTKQQRREVHAMMLQDPLESHRSEAVAMSSEDRRVMTAREIADHEEHLESLIE